MLHTLPWQEMITGLIAAAALVYLARRWWPGRPSKAACHGDSAAPSKAGAGSACGGGCSGCASASVTESPITFSRQRPS